MWGRSLSAPAVVCACWHGNAVPELSQESPGSQWRMPFWVFSGASSWPCCYCCARGSGGETQLMGTSLCCSLVGTPDSGGKLLV